MANSHRLRHCASRAKIFSSIIKLAISTLAVCPAPTAGHFESKIGKCCPYGRVIQIYKEHILCSVVKEEGERVIHQFNYHESNAGLLCPESENVTVAALKNIEQPFRGHSACIDILYESHGRKTTHLIFQCGANGSSEDALGTGSVALPELPKLRNCCDSGLTFDVVQEICIPEEEFLQRQKELRERWRYITIPEETLLCRSNGTGEVATGSLARTNFLTLRICCGVDKVYSVERRDCVPGKGRSNVPKEFRFLSRKFDFITVVRGGPSCQYALLDYIVDVTGDLRVKDDGSLEVILTTANGRETIIANENNTCLDRGDLATSRFVVIRACSDSKFCKEHTCVRKCCPDGQAWFWYRCDYLRGNPIPGRFHDVLLNESIARGLASHKNALNTIDYGLLIGVPCGRVQKLHDNWRIAPNGHLYLSNGKVFDHGDYCLDMTYPGNVVREETPPTSRLYLGECVETDNEYLFKIFPIHGFLESISCAFLIITLVVYICLPALRNLRGKILMCHMASLVVGYACFATITLGPIPVEICPSLGYATFFSWISAFSWLNVLCFDMWWNLSGKVVPATSEGQGDTYDKKFLLYSLYAWGYTFLASLICIAVDRTESVPSHLRPNIGIDSCWFSDYKLDYNDRLLYGEIIFFIIPVSLQLVANTIFFTLTARSCCRVKAQLAKMTDSLTEPRSQRFHAARKELAISIKLFMVMGLTFIFLLLFAVSLYYDFGLSWYLGFMFAQDAVNCLHALTIFFLCVTNGRVYKACLDRIGRGNPNNVTPADDAEALRARREVPSLLPIISSHQ